MFNKFLLLSLLAVATPDWAFSAEMSDWQAEETRIIARDTEGNPVEVEMRVSEGVYVGHVTDGVPNGFGTFAWSGAERRYAGNWSDGAPEGFGTFTWGETGRRYEGNWTDGLQDGHGIYVSSKGTRIPIYYEMGKLVADPATLPADYRVTTCLFAHAVAQSDIMAEPESVDVEEVSDGVVITVEPASGAGGIPTRCRFRAARNDDADELIELHQFGSEPITGAEAVQLGKEYVNTLFVPQLEP